MIKVSFILKRSPGEKSTKEDTKGKITGLTINVATELRKQGIVRLRNLLSEKDRLVNGQLVITDDGLGTIKEYFCKKDERGKLVLPQGINIAVRNLKFKNRVYRLNTVKVVDILDNKSGVRYPAVESDYSHLLVDDAPVEFVVTRKGKALLTHKSRKDLEKFKIFARKQNGIKLLNELINKKIAWTTKR
jgi:hypothetical protein